MKTLKKKHPESVLVVIYCSARCSILLLQRNDDATFWQSVTGSLEGIETPYATALREVWEETGIAILNENLILENGNYAVNYKIFEQFRHRYAEGVTHNKEHWFFLDLPEERSIRLTEHRAYCWQSWHSPQRWSKSWSNQLALEKIVKRFK